MCICSISQMCPNLCGPMNRSPPGSSFHGSFQARMPKQVTISYSRESYQRWILSLLCFLRRKADSLPPAPLSNSYRTLLGISSVILDPNILLFLGAIERCSCPYSMTSVCYFSSLNVSSLYLFCHLKKCRTDLILPSGWSVMCLPPPVLNFCCSLLQAKNPDNFVQNKTCLGCFAMKW